MKEQQEIIFVFRYESGEIKRVKYLLPLLVCQHDHVVPKGTKLYEVILRGAKHVDKVSAAGHTSPGVPITSIVRVSQSMNVQSFELQTPLMDEIDIAFEVVSNDGRDITNMPNPRKRPVEKSRGEEEDRPDLTEYEDYTEFAIHLDQEDHILETVS